MHSQRKIKSCFDIISQSNLILVKEEYWRANSSNWKYENSRFHKDLGITEIMKGQRLDPNSILKNNLSKRMVFKWTYTGLTLLVRMKVAVIIGWLIFNK